MEGFKGRRTVNFGVQLIDTMGFEWTNSRSRVFIIFRGLHMSKGQCGIIGVWWWQVSCKVEVKGERG